VNKDDKNKAGAEAIKQTVAQALRAVAGQAVDVRFAERNQRPAGLFAPVPPPADNKAPVTLNWTFNEYAPQRSITSLRAQADSAAFRRRYSDPAVNAAHRPQNDQAAAIFDLLERARYEARGGLTYAGAAQNIRTHLNETCAGVKTDDQPLSHEVRAQALYFAARQVMAGEEPPPGYAPAIARLRQELGHGALSRLAGLMHDQQSYAAHARGLLGSLDYDTTLPPPPPQSSDDAQEQDKDKKKEQQDGRQQPAPGDDQSADDGADAGDDESGGAEDDADGPADAASAMADEGGSESASSAARKADPDGASAIKKLGDSDDRTDGADGPDAPRRHHAPAAEPVNEAYRPYTVKYDEVIAAEKLTIDPQRRAEGRRRMDQLLQQNQFMIARLANRLQRKLMTTETNHLRCERDLQEGLLDTTRLPRIITDPLNAAIYMQEHENEQRDTVVTLLVDNSGSMRGQAILTAALSTEILARTLERCRVRVEILGFTTRAWRGGQAREDWQKAGQPANPGRLNDLRHIIYKSADMPYRRARPNIALMASGEEYLKENIDGEALQWAYDRLLARPEKRKILMVLSDGAPVDDSTMQANSQYILEKHIREVIARIEGEKRVELLAIGIGHDVRKYYGQSVTLPGVDGLGETMLKEIDRLFTPEDPRRARRRPAGPAPR
jgi:cobaltochelatase CobT